APGPARRAQIHGAGRATRARNRAARTGRPPDARAAAARRPRAGVVPGTNPGPKPEQPGRRPVIDESFLNRAAPPGSMRYFSLLYAPDDRRDAIAALYVIDAEIRESARSASHDVAHTRLQWWRAEVDRLVNGAPQHPATRVLVERHPADR